MENQQRAHPQYDAREATEAARHLLSLISRAIPDEPQGQRQAQSQVMQRPSVQSEMTRSFPGFFKGKKRLLPRGHMPAKDEDLVFIKDITSIPSTSENCCPQQEEDIQCPICANVFPVSEIEAHASCCGQRPCDESERVSFIGEAGIDNGALRKEFLTEMMAGIEKRFFEGGDNGKAPKYSMTDMDQHNFKTVGEIFAVSITQGGPPPNFFMQWCYNYLSTGEMDQEAITERDVTDPELMELIKQTEAADNTNLMECTDRIVSCGYTGQCPSKERKTLKALCSPTLYSEVTSHAPTNNVLE
ncbi:hypothetical protein UPYG_G00112860 [Umbra pygmaea]|uniref:Uncharacterized protein n=1 Tax=Umbra pygmaea TaxID=75934 RepID=A0ABD0X358_UMBPY